jgi:muramoyltetrapeptide carboxypeptidase
MLKIHNYINQLTQLNGMNFYSRIPVPGGNCMLLADKLRKGDEIRIIAPSKSLSSIPVNICTEAADYLKSRGYNVTFSKNCRVIDETESSSIQARIDDLHTAITDKKVKAILAARGGANVNQILEYINYSLIIQNPKIICGFSDVTALCNAIYAKTGLITYHGPQFSSFGSDLGRTYTVNSFESSVMQDTSYLIKPHDDEWKYEVLQPGSCQGQLVGGNLCTLNLLQGTEFMPDLNDKILFIEDNNLVGEYFYDEFDRNLQSLLHLKELKKIKAVIFGRFRSNSKMNTDAIKRIISTKKKLQDIPILYNVDFGHITPIATIPIGGTVKIVAENTVTIEVLEH